MHAAACFAPRRDGAKYDSQAPGAWRCDRLQACMHSLWSHCCPGHMRTPARLASMMAGEQIWVHVALSTLLNSRDAGPLMAEPRRRAVRRARQASSSASTPWWPWAPSSPCSGSAHGRRAPAGRPPGARRRYDRPRARHVLRPRADCLLLVSVSADAGCSVIGAARSGSWPFVATQREPHALPGTREDAAPLPGCLAAQHGAPAAPWGSMAQTTCTTCNIEGGDGTAPGVGDDTDAEQAGCAGPRDMLCSMPCVVPALAPWRRLASPARSSPRYLRRRLWPAPHLSAMVSCTPPPTPARHAWEGPAKRRNAEGYASLPLPGIIWSQGGKRV